MCRSQRQHPPVYSVLKHAKRGRPPRAKSTATTRLFVRLTEAEHELLQKAAENEQTTVSAYVRAACLRAIAASR